jgi:hypothetical protein
MAGMHEAMIYLITRSVPRELQPGIVVLALAERPLSWAEILGRPEEEIIDLLAEFYVGRDDLLQLSVLSGGCSEGSGKHGRGRRPRRHRRLSEVP